MVALLGAFLGWLAWERRFVHQRREARKTLLSHNATVVLAADGPIALAWDEADNYNGATSGQIPFWRHLVGDEEVTFVLVKRREDIAIGQEFFPEATLLLVGN